jgi:hypothetical protein
MQDRSDDPVVEDPEVLPPEGEPRARRARRTGRNLADAFGPLAAAVLVDAVDFVSFGQIGLLVGMFVGGTFTYVYTSMYGLPVWQRMLWSIAAGFYCLLPRTQLIPMATLVVAFSQYWRRRGRRG